MAEQRPDSVVKERPKTEKKEPTLFKVVLLNDDYSTMEFVVQILEGVREVSVGSRTLGGMGYSCALLEGNQVACWGARTQVDMNGEWVSSSVPVARSLL